jgi:tetratricopeptide (TPR) repeat protein
MEYENNDPQVLFNLSGAYSLKGMYRGALTKIQNCLKINPSYPQAQKLRNQLAQKLEQIN